MFSPLPLLPSEEYLLQVLARKRPRGPLLLLVRPVPGRPRVLYSANLLKAARRSMAMAWHHAVKVGAVLPSNNGERQIAAAVLAEFMAVVPGSYGNPGRIVYSGADYAHALQWYRNNLLPRKKHWAKIPGAPARL